MIDRKTFLVAQREFMENVRTKTFWIGIFMLPVIYAVAIGVTALLRDAKGVRTYTVLDRTEGQWLSQRIEARADEGDLLKIARETLEQARRLPPAVPTANGAGGPEELPDATELGAALEPFATNAVRREFVTRLTDAWAAARERLVAAGEPVERNTLLAATVPALKEWFRSLDAAELSLLAGRLDREKYAFVTLEELGIDPASPDVERELGQSIQQGRLFAYFVLPEDPLEHHGAYVSNNLTDDELRDWYAANATEIVREARIERANVDRDVAAKLLRPYTLEPKKVGESGRAEEVSGVEKASGFAPIAFVYLLWIAVFTAAQMLLTNTVEEKSNRLIEVLLSSVSPLQLMSGKIWGIAATGLTIVLSWVLTSLIAVQLIPEGSKLAELDLATIIGDPLYLASFVGYFLAGYLLYGAVLVAIGSVCNSLKEAQNLIQPVFLLLIVPLVAMFPVVQEPNGTVARILTYIPLFTPFLMMNRAAGPPPMWEYLATTVLILVSLWVAFRLAAKVFRVGILMTGKPPKIGEILRWLRTPLETAQTRAS